MPDSKILQTITSPHQLRRLDEAQLQQLAGEIRQTIIQTVSKRGGHLASNLGVTELTVALHYVFDFSRDRLLWDVGHQCYPHKLLTGRYGRFETLRQAGGISGFPDPAESFYDLFATGHAGTAISTAAGLAWADQQAGADTKVVAVVGDASIVNGLALEGINNAALLGRQFLIVLNDNSMAIDRTQGALSNVLDRVRTTHTYADIKASTEQLLQHLPLGDEIGEALRHIKDGLRTTIHGGKIFEALGFRYFGPIEGHDIGQLTRMLTRLAQIDRPALLHVHTEKGRGCQYAVEDPRRFHSPSPYTVQNGKVVFVPKDRPTWTAVFSEALVELARTDKRIVAITAAMPDGTGLNKFRQAFPDRYIDVGINESHAVAMAAGLAKAGLRPVIAIYSTFLQRAFDQIFHDVVLQHLPVIFCIDRAGVVGSDGAVHHGYMDIAYLRPLPGMTLMAPAEAAEMKAALEFALSLDGPAAIRYPRDEVPPSLGGPCPPFELARMRTVAPGNDGALLCYGVTVGPALEAAEQLSKTDHLKISVINARFAKPLDVLGITKLVNSAKPVLVCEDHATAGGFGSAVLELAAARGLRTSNVRLLALPDRFIAHATRAQQLTEVGLDAASIAATIKEMILHPAPAGTKRRS